MKDEKSNEKERKQGQNNVNGNDKRESLVLFNNYHTTFQWTWWNSNLSSISALYHNFGILSNHSGANAPLFRRSVENLCTRVWLMGS